MAQTRIRAADRTARRWSAPRVAHLTVHVWRRTRSAPQGLFTFAGAFDAIVLGAVMQHVHRLIREVPGRWRVEVVAVAIDRRLLRGVDAALLELQRNGLRARAAIASRCGTVLRDGFGAPTEHTLDRSACHTERQSAVGAQRGAW